MTRTTRWTRMLVAQVVLLATVLIAGGGPVLAGEPTLEGDNVITYQHQEVLAETHREIRQGTRLTSGGCEFRGITTLSGPDDAAVAELELAFDPDSCQSLVEIGTLVSSPPPPDGTQTMDFSETVTSGGFSTMSLGRWEAALWSWYSDPIGLHVNDMINSIEWEPSGDCALPPGTQAQVGATLAWFEPTQWYVASHVWDFGGDCALVWSDSTTHYQNDFFCAGQTTSTFYEPNRVEGVSDSNANYIWTLRKEGFCGFLLSSNRLMLREQVS